MLEAEVLFNLIGPTSVRIHRALASNDSLNTVLPTSNVWASRLVTASQILIVSSFDPEATSLESLEKATRRDPAL